ALQRAIVEKRDVLRPREPHHHPQPMPTRFVEEIASRSRVRADRVDAELRHQAEVVGHLGQRRKLVALRVGCEGAIRDTLDEVALVTDAKEFSVRGAPVRRYRPRLATEAWIVLDYGAHNRKGPLGQVPIVAAVTGRSGRSR